LDREEAKFKEESLVGTLALPEILEGKNTHKDKLENGAHTEISLVAPLKLHVSHLSPMPMASFAYQNLFCNLII